MEKKRKRRTRTARRKPNNRRATHTNVSRIEHKDTKEAIELKHPYSDAQRVDLRTTQTQPRKAQPSHRFHRTAAQPTDHRTLASPQTDAYTSPFALTGLSTSSQSSSIVGLTSAPPPPVRSTCPFFTAHRSRSTAIPRTRMNIMV